MKPDVVFCDLDDTLMHTDGINDEIRQRVFGRYFGDIDLSFLQGRGGIADELVIPLFEKQTGIRLTERKKRALLGDIDDYGAAQLRESAKPVPGAYPALLRLRDECRHLAICTSSTPRKVAACVAKENLEPDGTEWSLGDFFGNFDGKDHHIFCVYDQSLFGNGPFFPKPSPTIYETAATRLQADRQRSIALEDSKVGTGSAALANIMPVGCLSCVPKEEREARRLVLIETAQHPMTNYPAFPHTDIITLDDLSQMDQMLEIFEKCDNLYQANAVWHRTHSIPGRRAPEALDPGQQVLRAHRGMEPEHKGFPPAFRHLAVELR